MGKNQTPQMAQMSKGSRGGDGESGGATADGVDVSYHTAEWHAARLAALTVERPRWAGGRAGGREHRGCGG